MFYFPVRFLGRLTVFTCALRCLLSRATSTTCTRSAPIGWSISSPNVEASGAAHYSELNLGMSELRASNPVCPLKVVCPHSISYQTPDGESNETHPPIYSIHPTIHPPTNPSTPPPTDPSTHPPMHPSVHPAFHPSVIYVYT